MLRRQKEEYNKFSKAAGLQTENDRTQPAGFGRSQASKAVWSGKKASKNTVPTALTNQHNGGIINSADAFTEVETNTSKALASRGVEYNKVSAFIEKLSDDEIIKRVSGGDETVGSCASVALAYAGQKQGLDVLDYRDGKSRIFFSSKLNKVKMFEELGAISIVEDSAKTCLTNGKKVLGKLTENREYYLSVGRHAAIVRNNNGVLQYLELQDKKRNGWCNFGNIDLCLRLRFGCSLSSKIHSAAYATDISQLTGDNFRTILGYINTAGSKQKKGTNGNVK